MGDVKEMSDSCFYLFLDLVIVGLGFVFDLGGMVVLVGLWIVVDGGVGGGSWLWESLGLFFSC